MDAMLTEAIKVAVQWLFAPLLAIVALAWLCVRLEVAGAFDAIRSAVRKMPVGRRFAFFALAAGFIAFAGTKTNSPPMNMPPGLPILPPVQNPPLPALNPGTPSDAGFVVVGEETGPCAIVPPPVGAMTQETWRLRGAYEDHVRIPSAPGWSMLTPSGRVDSLDVLASGGFGVSPCDSFYPPPFADGFSLAPVANWNALAGEERVSIFWHALTPSNSLLATWQDALLGRSATNIVSFQAEFQPGGTFEYRYADRRVSYAPMPPFDLDGDGLENSVDPDPLAAGPDAHGTNAEWYDIVCSNVLSAAEGQDGVELSWLGGANSNAYFFAEVVADIGPAAVYFTCDTETSLGSPVVVALAGETNRVPLLVGVGYSVSSDVPFSVSVPEGASAVSNGVSAFHVERPVSFDFVPDTTALATGVVAYTVLVDPAGLEGSFAWESFGQPLANVECRIENGELSQPSSFDATSILRSPFSILHSSLGGTSILHSQFSILNSSGGCGFVGFGDYVIFTCGESCDCGGCEAVGSYTYENVYVPVSGGPCGCTPHDDPPEDPDDPPSGGGEPPDPPPPVPSVTVSFSTPAILFEDRYENSPGAWVEKRSTQTTLTIFAQGGEYGGTLNITSQNLDKLEMIGASSTGLPGTVAVGAFEHVEYTFIYHGDAASGSANDIRVTAEIVGNVTGDTDSSEAELTAVQVWIKATYLALLNPCENRHTYGVGEIVECWHNPQSLSLSWTSLGNGTISNSVPARLICPLLQDSAGIRADYGGASLPIPLNVMEPTGIECTNVAFLPATIEGIGMLLELSVNPLTVSFEGIAMQEVPSDQGVHIGYFNGSEFMHRWFHNTSMGAGEWIDIAEGNIWGLDRSRMLNWPQPWTAGQLVWDIPIGWNRCGTRTGTCVKVMSPVYHSTWNMTSTFLTKTKHGHSIGLSSDGRKYLDEEEQYDQ